MKPTKAELAAKGHAFDHGYDAQRAQRLFKEGVGHTAEDDLALALGYPLLVELSPAVDGDLVELTKQRINQPLRRLVPWPRNLAVRAVRAIAFGWDQFPDVLSAEASEAIERDDDFQEGEENDLLAALSELPSASWNHTYELCFLLEALAGGEATITALCDAIEEDGYAWHKIDFNRRIAILSLGAMLDRLSPERAASFRPRLTALYERYLEHGAADDPKKTGVSLRALDLVLNGAQGYERSASMTEWGRARTDAHFLDRDAFARLAKPLAPPLPHMLPSVQWVVQGGVGELAHAGDPKLYEFKGSKLEAHRYVVDQFVRMSAPEPTALVVAIATDPKSQPFVVEAVKRHIQGLRPQLEALAKSATDPALRAAASSLLASCLPS